MPETVEKEKALRANLEKYGCLPCLSCPSAEKGLKDEPSVFCAENAAFKDVSPWVSMNEARECPGHLMRRLILSAKAHYAKTPSDST